MEELVAFPPRRCKDGLIGQKWNQIPVSERMYIGRRIGMELPRGLEMKKDQTFGRPKYCREGFYGLEVAKDEVYRLEQAGADKEKLDAARKEVARLTAKLADDEDTLEAMDKWHRYFEERGTTTREALENFMRLEAGLRKDFTNGYFALADYVGFDPIEALQLVLANRQPVGGQAR
jgi:hypothetical protein